MSVYLECDRCGEQEKTRGVMLFAGLTGPSIPTARPELPDGWTRPSLPTEDGELRKLDLCPGCKADLLAFMAGRVAALCPPVRPATAVPAPTPARTPGDALGGRQRPPQGRAGAGTVPEADDRAAGAPEGRGGTR